MRDNEIHVTRRSELELLMEQGYRVSKSYYAKDGRVVYVMEVEEFEKEDTNQANLEYNLNLLETLNQELEERLAKQEADSKEENCNLTVDNLKLKRENITLKLTVEEYEHQLSEEVNVDISLEDIKILIKDNTDLTKRIIELEDKPKLSRESVIDYLKTCR